MSTSEPHQDGVSTREAAAILGVSPSDVLRRIRRGELRAERFTRNGGTYYTVYLDPPQAVAPDAAPIESLPAPEPHQDTSGATFDALIESHERLFEAYREIAELRERAGRAEATSEATSTHVKTLQAERDDLATRLQAAEDERDRLRERSRWKFWTW